MRNFDTLDADGDIALEMGEENEFALVGFYHAADARTGQVSQAGQSQDLYILMGATTQMVVSSGLLAVSLAIATSLF